MYYDENFFDTTFIYFIFLKGAGIALLNYVRKNFRAGTHAVGNMPCSL